MFDKNWPGHQTEDETIHFLAALPREYDYAGMGDSFPPSKKESDTMMVLAEKYCQSVKEKNNQHLWTSASAASFSKGFSYLERPDVFSFFCSAGIFDRLIQENTEKSQGVFLGGF